MRTCLVSSSLAIKPSLAPLPMPIKPDSWPASPPNCEWWGSWGDLLGWRKVWLACGDATPPHLVLQLTDHAKCLVHGAWNGQQPQRVASGCSVKHNYTVVHALHMPHQLCKAEQLVNARDLRVGRYSEQG